MIIDTSLQGSEGWIRVRLGKPTASGFDRIIQPAKLGPSAGQNKYLGLLLAEYLLDCPTETGANGLPYIERGKEHEVAVAKWLTMDTGLVGTPVGFCMTDDRLIGCSPDRLIGDDGGAEFKIPSIEQHMTYLLDDGKSLTADYKAQVQGCLWITGRKWWKLVSWNPDLPSVCLHVERDEVFIKALSEMVYDFAVRLEDLKRKYAPYRVPTGAAA